MARKKGMKLPEKDKLSKERYQDLYNWDAREYFAKDRKDTQAIIYNGRLNKVIKTVRQLVPSGGKVLDIGCAQGNFSLLLAEAGYKVIGGDIDSEALEYARMKYELGDCTFMVLNGRKLPFKNKFDAIILSEVLEHVTHPKEILLECKNHLNENGVIIIVTPNKLAPHNLPLLSYTKLKDKLEGGHANVKSSNSRWFVGHYFSFTPEELRKLLLECGFQILFFECIHSYFVNPLNIHKLLPYNAIRKVDAVACRIPYLKKYMTTTLFSVCRSSPELRKQ
jgi:2-polyprenyl-3-methyl-5-hydroxy-6-metoxy-1,4-benzoquinol methylase